MLLYLAKKTYHKSQLHRWLKKKKAKFRLQRMLSKASRSFTAQNLSSFRPKKLFYASGHIMWRGLFINNLSIILGIGWLVRYSYEEWVHTAFVSVPVTLELLETEMRYCSISKDMLSLHFGPDVFCQFEARVPEFYAVSSVHYVHCTVHSCWGQGLRVKFWNFSLR